MQETIQKALSNKFGRAPFLNKFSSASCVIFISNRIEVPLHQGLTKAALNKQKNIDGRMRLSQSVTIINKFARIILY
jgi:hypothetical protein